MATEVTLPVLGENLSEGEVLDVKVKAGDVVAEGQTLLEVEAEKSTVEVPSPAAGRVSQVNVKKGDVVKTGQSLCAIEVVATANAPSAQPARQEPKPPDPSSRTTKSTGPMHSVEKRNGSDGLPAAAADAAPARSFVPAGPATRHLARELGVDLATVPGSAPGGRVTQEDIKAFVRDLSASAAPARTSGSPPPALPDFGQWGPIEKRTLEPIRRRTAEHLSLAWRQIAQVTHFDRADITELDAFRRQAPSDGPKLTVTAFALKAAVIALKRFPAFNASLDLASNQLIVKRYYHLGVAVDTAQGLLVPVVRDVDKKTILELAKELGELAERARQRKLSADEMRGGTFTITNLGGLGGTGFSPIVNYPEAAILGLARAEVRPVHRDRQFVPRLLLPLSLSYDHRIIDGADAARFTRTIAELLSNPWQMATNA